MGAFVRVGRLDDFRVGRGRRIEIEGTPVAVFRTKDRVIALDDTCPHMGASLADGTLRDGTVQCSWHEWRYDLETGRCPVRPWAVVRIHRVRVEAGEVLVETPEPLPAEPPADDGPDWEPFDPERHLKKPGSDA